MGKVRKVVFRSDALRRGRRCGGEVTVVADHLARFACGLLERRLVGNGVVAGVRAIVPNDLQRLAALHCRPRVARDDRNPAQRIEHGRSRARVDGYHAHHAGDFECFGGVVALDRATVYRRPSYNRIEHAVDSRIHPILRFAGDDVPSIEELQLAGTNIAKLRRILEPKRIRCRDRHGCGRLGERSVAEAPAGRAMQDLAVFRLNFALHIPAPRPPLPAFGAAEASAAHGHEKKWRVLREPSVSRCRSAPRRPALPRRAPSRFEFVGEIIECRCVCPGPSPSERRRC